MLQVMKHYIKCETNNFVCFLIYLNKCNKNIHIRNDLSNVMQIPIPVFMGLLLLVSTTSYCNSAGLIVQHVTTCLVKFV